MEKEPTSGDFPEKKKGLLRHRKGKKARGVKSVFSNAKEERPQFPWGKGYKGGGAEKFAHRKKRGGRSQPNTGAAGRKTAC